MFAFDFETELILPGNKAPRAVCMSWAQEGSSGILRWDETESHLRHMLEEGSGPLIGANTAFDMSVAAANYPDLIPLIFKAYDDDRVKDVQIRQKLIDLARGDYFYQRGRGYSLQRLAHRILDVELEKEDTWRLRYGELRDLPIEQWPHDAVSYSVKDSEITLAVYLEQESATERIFADEPAQCRAHFALTLMSAWGIAVDQEAVERLRVYTIEKMNEHEAALVEAGLLVWNKKTQGYSKKKKPAQERMHAAMGFTGKITKTGLALKKKGGDWKQLKYLSLDEEACRDSLDPLLDSYAEYSALGNYLSGHIKALTGQSQVHTNFESLLETGRTSSKKPNIQNVRRKPGARECYVPRPGTCFIGCDYDKAELHTLSQVCINLFGRSKLADALNAGFDPHTGLGAKLAGITYEEALVRLDAQDKEIKKMRQWAKPANFGFPGGMGAKGMRAYAKNQTKGKVILSLADAERLKRGWAKQWPEVAEDYLRWIGQLCSGAGHTTIKHFGSNRLRGKIAYCAAANSFFQGMASDGAKRAMFRVAEACYNMPSSPLYGCRPVNFIHDELLLEAPLDRASDAAWVLRDIMVREFNHFTPDVPVRATPCLMDHWSKEARTLTGANNQLLVWEYHANSGN